MEKYKKVQEKKDLYIQFSDEEMEELGWEENQKLSFSLDEKTGAITLKPFVKVDIDISEWDRSILEFLIDESCKKDISVNEVISNFLEKQLDTYEE